MTPSRPLQLRWLRRRWWALVVPTIVIPLVVATASDASTASTAYTSRALLLVTPSSGLAASELASTYALFLTQDERLTGAVARAADVEALTVRGALRATRVENAPLLELSYVASTPEESMRILRVVVNELTGPRPPSPTILPRSLTVVRIDDVATASSAGGSANVPVAAVVGLILGAVLVAALERADARFEDEHDLADEAGCPVSALREATPADAEILLMRWAELHRSSDGVTLVPIDARAHTLVADLVPLLRDAVHAPRPGLDDRDLRVAVNVTSPASGPDAAVLVPPNHVVVLVTGEEPAVRHVRTALRRLVAGGTSLDWALVVSRRRNPVWPPRGPAAMPPAPLSRRPAGARR